MTLTTLGVFPRHPWLGPEEDEAVGWADTRAREIRQATKIVVMIIW